MRLRLCAFHSTSEFRQWPTRLITSVLKPERAPQRAGRTQPDRGRSSWCESVRRRALAEALHVPLRSSRVQLRGRPQSTQTLTTDGPLPSRVRRPPRAKSRPARHAAREWCRLRIRSLLAYRFCAARVHWYQQWRHVCEWGDAHVRRAATAVELHVGSARLSRAARDARDELSHIQIMYVVCECRGVFYFISYCRRGPSIGARGGTCPPKALGGGALGGHRRWGACQYLFIFCLNFF